MNSKIHLIQTLTRLKLSDNPEFYRSVMLKRNQYWDIVSLPPGRAFDLQGKALAAIIREEHPKRVRGLALDPDLGHYKIKADKIQMK
jgi:hypothetical protein